MGGPNLEVFKVRRPPASLTSQPSNPTNHSSQFGMYIMFPIGTMYYFGTNLDSRFAVPDFWPKEGQTHTIPFEREEISEELQRLKERRLQARAMRLEIEKQGGTTETFVHREEEARNPRPDILEATKVVEPERSQVARSTGWRSWFQ